MGLIYLSGPITGTTDYIARFAKAQTRLEKNWNVINPAAVIYQLPPLHYETIMKIDLQLLDICDAIYMMFGWKDSLGACQEYQFAKENGLIIVYESEEQMNKIILMGRLTRDPEVRYGGVNNTAIARFSIAVDRRFKREGQPQADFFNCTALGKLGEFVEKYLQKGTKILLDGEMQNDNYKNKEGRTVYGFRIIANNIEFAESKKSAQESQQDARQDDDFMDVPKDDGELPFI